MGRLRLFQSWANNLQAKSSLACPLQHGWTEDESLSPPLNSLCIRTAPSSILRRPHQQERGWGDQPPGTPSPQAQAHRTGSLEGTAGDIPAGVISVRVPVCLPDSASPPAHSCLLPSVFLLLLTCASACSSVCVSLHICLSLCPSGSEHVYVCVSL